MLGLLLVLAGAALTGVGARIALERPRPMNLAGMLLAPIGLALVLLGVGRWLSPGFLGGATPAGHDAAAGAEMRRPAPPPAKRRGPER